MGQQERPRRFNALLMECPSWISEAIPQYSLGWGAFWLSPNLQKRRCFAAMRVMSCKHPACVFLPFKRDAWATFADCQNQPILDK